MKLKETATPTTPPAEPGEQVRLINKFSNLELKLKQTQARYRSLKKEQRKYQKLVEGSTEFIISLRPDLSLLYANQAFCIFMGFSPKEIVKQSLTSLFETTWSCQFQALLSTLSVEQPTGEFDDCIVQNNSNSIWLHWRIQAFYDKEKQPVEFVAFGRDISARRKILSELQQSEERYRTLVENQSDLVTRSTPDTTILFANKAYASYFKLSQNKLEGKTFIDLVPSKERRQTLKMLATLSPSNPTVKYEQQYVVQHQSKWQQWLCKGLFNDRGELQEILSIGRDVTELIDAEQKLKASHDQLVKKQNELTRKNTALHEVLAQIEVEKKQIKEQIMQNVDLIIDPLLQRIISEAPSELKASLSLLEITLQKLTSPFGKTLSMLDNKLSPREMEICSMIRNGLTGKEIARLLNLSFNTIETHRARIRSKLGLTQEKINLTSYLRSLD